MKVKKIAALAVGAAMVGATIGFASAQPTVPNIPKSFFVKNGQPNAKIVVGSQGAAMDVASAADIAVAMGTLLYTEKDVSVKDASVVVKKDVAYDPADIPVFDNTFMGNYQVGENLANVPNWWNGGFDSDGNPYFNAKFTDSAWAGGIYDKGWDILVPGAIEWKDGNNDKYWKDPNGNWHSAEDVYLHYNIHIGKVELKQIAEDNVDFTNIDDFNSFTLVVDDVVANVSFSLNAYEKTLWDPVLGAVGTTYTIGDLKPAHYSLYQSGVIAGVEVGDTVDLFGKTVKILDLQSNSIEYGNDWGSTYIDAGTSKTFGDYTVKVLDIDVNQAKALLEISGPAGSWKITLNKDDSWTSPDYGIRVTLDDTFIGIGGTTSAEVSVQTDINYIENGHEFIPGWIAQFSVQDGKLMWFALTNKDKLSGNEVKLFDTYVMKYNADIMKKQNPDNDKTYAAMEAYVTIDPLKPQYTTQTLKVGDTLEGWTIDKITATADPAKAAVVSKVTTPITVLDTEIMEKGLDKVDSNLILIGGPAVNSVTAALADGLGIPANYTGWKSKYGTGADSGVVIYKAECGGIGGHGVVLVAGTDREGTKAAAEALMEYLAGLH